MYAKLLRSVIIQVGLVIISVAHKTDYTYDFHCGRGFPSKPAGISGSACVISSIPSMKYKSVVILIACWSVPGGLYVVCHSTSVTSDLTIQDEWTRCCSEQTQIWIVVKVWRGSVVYCERHFQIYIAGRAAKTVAKCDTDR